MLCEAHQNVWEQIPIKVILTCENAVKFVHMFDNKLLADIPSDSSVSLSEGLRNDWGNQVSPIQIYKLAKDIRI